MRLTSRAPHRKQRTTPHAGRSRSVNLKTSARLASGGFSRIHACRHTCENVWWCDKIGPNIAALGGALSTNSAARNAVNSCEAMRSVHKWSSVRRCQRRRSGKREYSSNDQKAHCLSSVSKSAHTAHSDDLAAVSVAARLPSLLRVPVAPRARDAPPLQSARILLRM
jgi:hypothetical protein